jgi:uncharacterized phage protein gp47/JayE
VTTYGVTSNGFVPKTLEVIKAEMEADFQAIFGASVQLDSASDFGQLIGSFADRFAELWSLGQALDAAFDPDRNSGAQQDSLCAITGTTRAPATKSTATGYLTGTNGTVIGAGKVVSVAITAVRFALQAGVTLANASAWANAHDYALGDIITNAGNIYGCRTPGHSAAAPTGTSQDITDGTAHWRYLGPGEAYAAGSFQAEDTGVLVALAGTLSTIETPVAGWSGVNNLLDATVGTTIESDAALRIRREQELSAQGNAVQDAIRGDVLEVDGVTACTVLLNNTDLTNSSGLPPHSVEVIAEGGTDADVRAAIWGSLAGGIQPYGNTYGTLVDSQGNTQPVPFSRPVPVNIWVIINVNVDATQYPSDGDAEVKTAVLNGGNSLPSARDVTSSFLASKAFGVPGMLDVTSCLIGTANPPVASTTIGIALRQISSFDSSRITVVSTPVTP